MGDGTEAAVAIRRYEAATILALFASVGVHVAQALAGFDPYWLVGCNFGIIFSLALLAVRAHRASEGAFDSAVAAETIVAFGVLALILGLVVAIYRAFALAGEGLRFDLGTVGELGRPFALGLAAAGVAPVVAVLLRNFSAEHGRERGPADELDAATAAAVRLAATLDAVRAAAVDLGQAVGDAAAATARLGPELSRHLSDVADATGRVAPTLDMGASQFSGLLEAGAKRFIGEVDGAGARFAADLDGARRPIAALADAARGGAGDMAGLADELSRARAGAAETAELFAALNDLTASVERFVATRGPVLQRASVP
ncbi:hypothetical protein [Sphingomonas lenta]|nr:hypothetical protein [Sphingomonas lenta]